MKNASAVDNQKKYVLDTSAILAFREDEEGSGVIENLLDRADKGKVVVYASFMSYMEAYYCIWKREGEAQANRTFWDLKILPIEMVGISEKLLLRAGEIKAKYKLSVADAWIIATALEKGAVLVHKDPQLRQVEDIVEMLEL